MTWSNFWGAFAGAMIGTILVSILWIYLGFQCPKEFTDNFED